MKVDGQGISERNHFCKMIKKLNVSRRMRQEDLDCLDGRERKTKLGQTKKNCDDKKAKKRENIMLFYKFNSR